MQRALGIDLGTTNSVVARMRRGVPQIIESQGGGPLTPSVVGVGPDGALLVGAQARVYAATPPPQTIFSIKRLMGRTYADPAVRRLIQRMAYPVVAGPDGDARVQLGRFVYTPVEISALILRRLKEEAEARTGERFTRAVITAPAYFGERQVAATREAGRLAGFRVMRIINEPTAAALAYGLDRRTESDGKVILVYDLGGGTFDISILLQTSGAFTVLGIEGDTMLGGDDFDRDLVEWMLGEARARHGVDLSRDPEALHQLRTAAEVAKIRLSNEPAVELHLAAVGAAGVGLSLAIGRTEFEAMIRPRLECTVELTHKAIREAHTSTDQISAVLLVGGSTATPLVREVLIHEFGAGRVHMDVDPMQCVALGAAIQTVLLPDLECTACQQINAVQHDYCTSCRAPLFGGERVACPSCFTLAESGRTTCRKCRGALPPPPELPPEPAVSEPSAVTGLRCAQCGAVTDPGADRCPACHAPVVLLVADVTPKHLGVALDDGRMAVMIEKGTAYPTDPDLPMSKEFYTTVIDQRRLEVAVYEGSDPVAERNELCGIVTLSLPPGLPRGTPLNVTFGLDHDRTLLVAVRIRASGVAPRQVQLRRGQVDPERQRKITEQRVQVTRFLDRWEHEVTEAERRDLHALIDQLDQALVENADEAQLPLDTLINHASRTIRLASRVRGTDAMLMNLPSALGRRLMHEQRAHLAQLGEQINEARYEADWARAAALVQQADMAIERLGEPLRLAGYARILALQKKLSPRLSTRVLTLLDEYDDAHDRADRRRLAAATDRLYRLWSEIETDLRQNETDPLGSAGITDSINRAT
jgi:molecular chaperone DnaK (HSP70)